jgi:Predicted hydrolases or acyltransferases (alpha/beta hydrolase superfamily)
MEKTLVFIHGLEGTAQGTKGQFFYQNFPQMIIEDYIGDFALRMNKLNRLLAGRNNLIIVGSSYGGLMAVQYAMKNESRVKKLILLAPALNLPEFKIDSNKILRIPVIIYHGKNDDVVDPQIVKKIALKCFSNLEHHLVKDDHSLHKKFPALDWKNLLTEG